MNYLTTFIQLISNNIDKSRTIGDTLSHRPVIAGQNLFFISFLTLILNVFTVSAQDLTRTIERSAGFSNLNSPDNELRVYNINGSVTVTGYQGSEVKIIAVKEIEGDEKEVALANEELTLRVEEEGNRVLIYLDAPFITLDHKNNRINYRMGRWEDTYDFLYDITIRVPKNAHVYASTINRGMVTVEETMGSVTASNVNGPLQLRNIAGTTRAHTVNGDIDARYSGNPIEDSKYQTVNGTIEVNYPADLSADIRFKSLHGELYTDFQNIERLQARVTTNNRKSQGRTTYHFDRIAPIRIGNGGPIFDFEVLNGDVYIKRIQS